MKFYILTFFVIGCIQWVLDKKIRKERTYGGTMSDTDGFKLYVLTLCIIAAVFITTLFFLPPIHPIAGVLLMVTFGARALIERKYIRSTNRHVVSILLVGVSLVVTILYTFLWQIYYT